MTHGDHRSDLGGILDAVRDGETIALPSLLGAELCVLGAKRHALVDGILTAVWEALDTTARRDLDAEVREGLARRRLLAARLPRTYEQAATRERPHPALQLVITARAVPAFIGVCGVGSDAADTPAPPRLFGLGDPPVAVVVEQPPDGEPENPRDLLTGVYRYTVAPLAAALDQLAAWLIRPTPKPSIARMSPERTVDLIRPGGPAAVRRIACRGDGQRAQVTTGDSGRRHAMYTNAQLRDLIQGIITTRTP